MFFQQLWQLFKRRPRPAFEIGEYVLIAPPAGKPRPVARYTVIRARRWVKADRLWVYSGPVIVAIGDHQGRAHNHIRHYVKTLTEGQLEKVRGGTQGL